MLRKSINELMLGSASSKTPLAAFAPQVLQVQWSVGMLRGWMKRSRARIDASDVKAASSWS